jgi:hypothetical protein
VHAEKVGAVALLDDAAELLLLRGVDVIVVAKVLARLPQNVDGLDVSEANVALGPLLELKRRDFVPGLRQFSTTAVRMQRGDEARV